MSASASTSASIPDAPTSQVAVTNLESEGDYLSLRRLRVQPINVSLTDYLARPVLLYTFTGSGPSTALNTFQYADDYFALANVAQKLKYFSLARGTFKLDFELTTSPWAVGQFVCGEWKGDFASIRGIAPTADAVRYSMTSMNHVILDCSTCNRASMTIPFCSAQPYVPVSAAVGNSLMNIYWGGVMSLSTQVFSSQDATNMAWTIRVYASVVDAEVAVPIVRDAASIYTSSVDTHGVSPCQPLPEFKMANGPISGPASIFAFAARKLSNVPVIGPFALASSLLASGVGMVATLFGFSRPRLVAEECFPHAEDLASYDTPLRSKPLTVDPQAEVIVSPDFLGESGDNLTYNSTIRRWGLMSFGSYSTYSAAGSIIYTAPVSPANTPAVLNDSGNAFCPSPLAYVSSMFEFWRGDIEYKFVIPCNSFVRGKLRFFWHPNNTITSADYQSITQNAASVLLDLTQGSEITLTVPWASVYNWQSVAAITCSVTDYNANGYFHNGYLFIAVEEPTVVPGSTSQQLDVLVWVRAGDNFRFNLMTVRKLNYLRRQPYLAAYSASATQQLIPSLITYPTPSLGQVTGPVPGDSTYSVYTSRVEPIRDMVKLLPDCDPFDASQVTMGEDFTSLRPYLKRLTYTWTYNPATYTGNTAFVVPYMPPEPGFSTVSTNVYYPEAVISPLRFISNMFYGVRGSVRYHLQPRYQSLFDYSVFRIINQPLTTYSFSGIFSRQWWEINGGTGKQLFRASQGESVQFDIPQQSAKLYATTTLNPFNNVYPCYGASVLELCDSDSTPRPFDLHVAAGEDFMPVIWNGCPLLWAYTAGS